MKLHIVNLIFAVLIALPFHAQTVTKKRGKFTTYYPNGKKESSGKVKNFKKQGEWKYWDDQGNFMKAVHYKNDTLNGLSTEYYQNKAIQRQGSYINGVMNGSWNSYFPNGKPFYTTNYKDGNYDGLQTWFFADGKIHDKSFYKNGKTVYHFSWFYGGRLQSVEYYKDGLPDGTWRVYPDSVKNGDTLPAVITNYANGKQNGLYIKYTNGVKEEETMYADGKKSGNSKMWDNKGRLMADQNFRDGKFDGTSTYYLDGIIARSVNYRNGLPDGKSDDYDRSGNITQTKFYGNGQLDSSLCFSPAGKLLSRRVYQYFPGFITKEQFSNYTLYDSAGRPVISGRFHFEQRVDDWTTFYPDGKIKSVTHYSDGKILGAFKKYYANGKPMINANYDGFNITGKAEVWDEKGHALKPGTKQYDALLDGNRPGEMYDDPSLHNRKRIDHDLGVQDDTVIRMKHNSVDEDNYMLKGDTVIFSYAEEPAKFPGDSLLNFLTHHIHYPKVDPPVNATIWVRFVVEKDGSLSGFQVVRAMPANPQFSAEAIRVMKLSPKWIPAKMNGRPVRFYYTMPVRFTTQ